MPLVEHYHQDGIVSGDVRQPLQLPPPRRGRRGALRHQSRAVYRGGNHHEPHKLNNLIRPKFNYCPPQRISFFRSAPGIPVIAAPRTGAAHLSSLCRQRGPFYMRPVTDSASAARSSDPIQESAPRPTDRFFGEQSAVQLFPAPSSAEGAGDVVTCRLMGWIFKNRWVI